MLRNIACYILCADAGVHFLRLDWSMKARLWLLLLLALFLMPFSVRTQSRLPNAPAGSGRKLSDAGEAWVSSTLAKMTLDEKLGQLLTVVYYGGFISEQSREFRELVREVEQNHVGGLMVGTRTGPVGIERSSAYPTAALANLLQSRAKIPLLVAADFERGTAMRLVEGTSFPHAMALAATGRTEDAYTMGRITALEGRAIGVPWIFAPVADVNSEPDNPIINIRSFGEDPQRVAALVAAYIRGVEENGGLATAKHFPGHGDTDMDSHLDLPTIETDAAHLERVELPPFRAAIAAGVSTMMTGHIAVPALEPDASVPATMSRKISTDLLRQQMGFAGLVVTDSLDMGGVTVRYPPAEIAVRAVLAGADVLLTPPAPDAALAGLREAAATGRIPLARIDEAVTHVLRAKARLGLYENRQVSLEALPSLLGSTEFAREAQDIADRGVTLLRDTPHALPLDPARPTRALLVAIAGDPDVNAGQELERELRSRVDSLKTLRFDTRFVDVASLKLPPAESYDVMIVAIFVRVADRKGSIGLPDDQADAVHRLLVENNAQKTAGVAEKRIIVASFGSPYVIERFPEAATWIAAFSGVDVAAARGRASRVWAGGDTRATTR